MSTHYDRLTAGNGMQLLAGLIDSLVKPKNSDSQAFFVLIVGEANADGSELTYVSSCSAEDAETVLKSMAEKLK